jgi:hypothetical protein
MSVSKLRKTGDDFAENVDYVEVRRPGNNVKARATYTVSNMYGLAKRPLPLGFRLAIQRWRPDNRRRALSGMVNVSQ